MSVTTIRIVIRRLDPRTHLNKITSPMLALWGGAGIASSASTPLDTWHKWATNVRGQAIDSGHFLAEENPQATADALLSFFLEQG